MPSNIVEIAPRSMLFAQAAPWLRMWLMGAQDSGPLVDYMGEFTGGPDAAKFDGNFSDAEAWAANPGFFTAGPSITDYAVRPPHWTHDFSLAGNAVLIGGRCKFLGAGVTKVVMGSFTSSTGPYGGFQLTMHSSGALQCAVSPVDGSGNQTASISNTYGPQDGAEHSFLFAFPPDFVSVPGYLDGAAAGTSAAGNASGKDCAGGNWLSIGASRAGSATAVAFADVFIIVIPTLTLAAVRHAEIAAYLHRKPMTPPTRALLGLLGGV